jgi:hypothetical protein
MVHYDPDSSFQSYLDVHIVLAQSNKTKEIQLYENDVPEIDLVEERTMRRVGYMETTYDTLRDGNAIWEDVWWRYMVLK